MALIKQPIGPMSYERIRDAIAAILLEEMTAQRDLQTDPEIKRIITEMQIWSERFVPMNQEDIFAIVIFFFASRYDNQDVRFSDSSNIFYIDCFGKAFYTQDNRGDAVSSTNLQILMRLIYKILESPHYIYLGFTPPPAFIKTTKIVSMKRTEEEDNQSAGSHHMYRIIFEVEAGETLEDTQSGPLIANNLTTVKIAETEKGFIYEFSS